MSRNSFILVVFDRVQSKCGSLLLNSMFDVPPSFIASDRSKKLHCLSILIFLLDRANISASSTEAYVVLRETVVNDCVVDNVYWSSWRLWCWHLILQYIYINELSVCLNLTIVANEETVCSIVFSYSGCGLRREKHIYIIFLKKDARMS
jgi:hypothetical protein